MSSSSKEISKHTVSYHTMYGTIPADVLLQAKKIKLLVCDIDGVFSDGRIYLGNDGEELKAFHTKDGFGIKCFQLFTIIT